MITTPRWVRELEICVGDRNPGASPRKLRTLQKGYGGKIPQDVVAAYADHDGTEQTLWLGEKYLPARMLSIEEMLENRVVMAEIMERSENQSGDILWMWGDDNSNYIGLILDGPLTGMLVVLDHDEPDSSPAYRTLSSFVSRMLRAVRGQARVHIATLPAELPTKLTSVRWIERDRALAFAFLKAFEACTSNEDRRRNLAQIALRFLPVAEMDLVVPLLFDKDMYIGATAVALIALRRWKPGIPHLGRLAEIGWSNAQSAACSVLLGWQSSPEAGAECMRVEPLLRGDSQQIWEMYKRPAPHRPPF